MSLPSTLASFLAYFEASPRFAMQLGLERIAEVAKSLNLLYPGIPLITVAGTNGKGSTVRAIEAIYTSSGYRVGVYTSPHLFTFNERIAINQQPITDVALCDIFTIIERARGEIALTYFETATLAAMYHFTTSKVDIIVLEVGMGGRLDATNLWDADLAVITTIDFDHEAHLGTTLEAIGREKAGILRAKQKAIYADYHPPASINEQAELLQTEIYYLGKDYRLSDPEFSVTFKDQYWHVPKPPLEKRAIAAALVATHLLHDRLPLLDSAMGSAFDNITLIGRQQLLIGPVNLLFDVAHNPQSVTLLAAKIQQLAPRGKVRAVFSALKDKNIANMIDILIDIVDVWYTSVLQVSRAASALQINEALQYVTSAVHFTPTIEMAYQNAYSHAETGDLIVVFGSFYVVSQVMECANV